jgi:hypothetical protein
VPRLIFGYYKMETGTKAQQRVLQKHMQDFQLTVLDQDHPASASAATTAAVHASRVEEQKVYAATPSGPTGAFKRP